MTCYAYGDGEMNRPSCIAVLRGRGERLYVQATVVDVTVKFRIGR